MNILCKLILLYALTRSLQCQPINQSNSKNSSTTKKINLNDSVLVIGDRDDLDQNKTINLVNPMFKIKNLNVYILDNVDIDIQSKKSPFRTPKKVKIINNGTKTLKHLNGLFKLFDTPNSETDNRNNILRRAESQLFPEINPERLSDAIDIKELGFNIEPLENKYHRQILSNNVSPHHSEENVTLPNETRSNTTSHVEALFKMTASLGDKINGLIQRIKGNLPPFKGTFKKAFDTMGECAKRGAQLVMEGITKTFDEVKSSDIIKRLQRRLEEGGEKAVKFFRNFGQGEKEIKDPFKFLVEDGVLSEKDLQDLLNFYQNKFSKKNP